MNDDCIDTSLHRAWFLRKRADWCIEMATVAFNSQMFRKYVDLAAVYQKQAADIERLHGGRSSVEPRGASGAPALVAP
jgi:hypothetical protein